MVSESQHSKRLSVVGGLGTDCLAAYRAISLPHPRRLLAYHEPVRQLLVLWAGLGGHRPCWNRTLLSAARSLEAGFRFSVYVPVVSIILPIAAVYIACIVFHDCLWLHTIHPTNRWPL